MVEAERVMTARAYAATGVADFHSGQHSTLAQLLLNSNRDELKHSSS